MTDDSSASRPIIIVLVHQVIEFRRCFALVALREDCFGFVAELMWVERNASINCLQSLSFVNIQFYEAPFS